MHPLMQRKMPLKILRQMPLKTLLMKLKLLTGFRSRPSPVPGQQPPQSIKFSFS